MRHQRREITAFPFLAPSEGRHPEWRRKPGLGLAGRSGSTGSHHELGRRVETDRASAEKEGGIGAAKGRPVGLDRKPESQRKLLGALVNPSALAGPGPPLEVIGGRGCRWLGSRSH
jgi:hypothetical protein